MCKCYQGVTLLSTSDASRSCTAVPVRALQCSRWLRRGLQPKHLVVSRSCRVVREDYTLAGRIQLRKPLALLALKIYLPVYWKWMYSYQINQCNCKTHTHGPMRSATAYIPGSIDTDGGTTELHRNAARATPQCSSSETSAAKSVRSEHAFRHQRCSHMMSCLALSQF